MGRGRKATRWDEDNAVGLCMGCHVYLDSQPLEKVEFFRGLLGDKLELLQARARTPVRYLDKAALKLYFEEKLKRFG